jgi:SAM-dependent methyltransferase
MINFNEIQKLLIKPKLYENLYDLALMIYYDYAVLSYEERRQVLTAIYRALKPGGKFIFDVFTKKAYDHEKESFHYRYYEKGGFYKKEAHLCLQGHYIYEDSIRLDQYVLISDHGIESIHVWDKAFGLKELKAEISQVAFKVHSLYSDVKGQAYDEDSKTICMVLEK